MSPIFEKKMLRSKLSFFHEQHQVDIVDNFNKECLDLDGL